MDKNTIIILAAVFWGFVSPPLISKDGRFSIVNTIIVLTGSLLITSAIIRFW